MKEPSPFDDLEAQTELGGYPFTDEKLKSKGINGVNTHQVIDAGKDSIGNDIVVADIIETLSPVKVVSESLNKILYIFRRPEYSLIFQRKVDEVFPLIYNLDDID